MLRMFLRTLNRSQVERQGKPAMPGVPMKERRSVLSYRHVDALSKASRADPLCIDGILLITGARGIDDGRRSWCRDFADKRKQHPDARDPSMVAFKCFSHLADRTIKDGSGFTRSARSIWSTEFSSEEIEVRQAGLRETIIRASNPATMMERVLAGALD